MLCSVFTLHTNSGAFEAKCFYVLFGLRWNSSLAFYGDMCFVFFLSTSIPGMKGYILPPDFRFIEIRQRSQEDILFTFL